MGYPPITSSRLQLTSGPDAGFAAVRRADVPCDQSTEHVVVAGSMGSDSPASHRCGGRAIARQQTPSVNQRQASPARWSGVVLKGCAVWTDIIGPDEVIDVFHLAHQINDRQAASILHGDGVVARVSQSTFSTHGPVVCAHQLRGASRLDFRRIGSGLEPLEYLCCLLQRRRSIL